MRKIQLLLGLLTLLSTAEVSAMPEPVGSYDDGELIDGACLPATGAGYMQLFRDVDHIWGTMPLIRMISRTGREMNERFPGRDRMQVEDMSGPDGGPIDPHGSHQNGLDVDIGYFKANGLEHDPKKTGQQYAPSMVEGGKVSQNFDLPRNWAFVKTLHKHGSVQRIFMDQTLKRALCAYAKSSNDYAANIEVLRSIRHVDNHSDHLHVRLRCPPGAKRCVPQADPPKGSGCP